ncbi:MAG: hypothetical protein HY807_08415 [Nitrospirae bacterium]|nr:hypothetical protein [Nitrospirota bacterium]
MKPLILFTIACAVGLLSLIVTRTYTKNRAAIIFFTADIALLIAIYYFMINLFYIFAYLVLLFLFLFILSIMRVTSKNSSFLIKDSLISPDTRRSSSSSVREGINAAIKYASFGHLALSSILVSVFMLPEIYHSIAITAGVGMAFFSLINLSLVRQRRNLLAYDKAFLHVLYIKVIVLALSMNPFFLWNYSFVAPLSSLLVIAAGYGVLFKGELFIFRVRASADMLWKALLLISLIIYGVILVYLDRYSPQDAFAFYIRIFLVSAFIIISGTLFYSREARLKVKFFILRHLYVSRYNLLELLTRIFSLYQKSNESMNFFIKEVMNYFFENYPFSCITFMFSAKDNKIEEKIGEQGEGSFPLRFRDETSTAKIEIVFYSKVIFDEDDRMNLRLIAELLFRMTYDMYLTRSKVFREKLEIAERLKLFLIHDLKNICHTLNMLEKNISRVQPSEAEEFLNDFRLTVPHLVKRAEKILNTIGILREGNNPTIFSLKDVIDEILKLFHKKQIFITNFDGDDRIYADRAAVMVALENILRNAHDKSFEDARLEISIHGSRVDENYVLTICDDGIPMPEEVAGRIFEPFFTTKKGGIGVGLYQTKEFIVSQHGTVEVQNSPSGVCFIIKLPVGQHDLFHSDVNNLDS